MIMDLSFTVALLVLWPFIGVLYDCIGQALACRKKYTFSDVSNDDFTLLVPIYGNVKYLENIEYLRQYGNKVVLCTTGDETQEFYQQLGKIASDNNFRIYRDEPANSYHATNATQKRATSGTIRDRLIRNALSNAVTTEYVVPIDADTTTPRPVQYLVGELVSHGWDIASIRIVLTNRDESILTKLQYHEYTGAMQLRLLVPWLISGACHVAKTDVLRDIMLHHSLFFQGNDVEIGLIAVSRQYKVGHIPFEVSTAVPATTNAWFRQRLAWAGGEFRLFITNFKFIAYHPFLWTYGAIVAIMMFPFRWYSLMEPSMQAHLFTLVILTIYYLAIISLHYKTRDRWLLLMPFYTLFSSLVMTPLGIYWYFKMAKKDKNYGIIKPHRELNDESSTASID